MKTVWPGIRLLLGASAVCWTASLLRAGPPHPADDQVQAKIDEILARPEYRAQSNELARFIADLLRRLFGSLSDLSDTSPVLFWLLVAVLLAVLCTLLGHMFWTVKRVLLLSCHRPADDEQDAARRRRLSADCQDEALRRAQAGDFTEAIRYLFLALVYRFDERGQVNFQKAYTNREYLELFDDRPPVRDQLRVFVDALDDHWYGQQPALREQYEQCAALFARLT